MVIEEDVGEFKEVITEEGAEKGAVVAEEEVAVEVEGEGLEQQKIPV